ncbi:MAG: SCO family protein [Gammaproteobacteria bacterium]
MDKNKAKLTFLLLIAALPIGSATWYFGMRENSGLMSTTNKGELVIPVVDVTTLDLRNGAGEPAYLSFDELVAGVDPEDYEPRPWQLLYLGAPECDDTCVERLYFLRQLHVRLGKEFDRVQRVYVQASDTSGPLPAATAAFIAEQQPDMRIVYANAAALREKLRATVASGADPLTQHYIYVVDPVGNVMLYFTPENTPDEILSDLDKLLDNSSLG